MGALPRHIIVCLLTFRVCVRGGGGGGGGGGVQRTSLFVSANFHRDTIFTTPNLLFSEMTKPFHKWSTLTGKNSLLKEQILFIKN